MVAQHGDENSAEAYHGLAVKDKERRYSFLADEMDRIGQAKAQ